MNKLLAIATVCLLPAMVAAGESVTPYSEETVPKNAIDLWKDVDFAKDPLETKVIREWQEEGVVCRYVTFKIGTFKGADARLAAFYTFPAGMKSGPAFVWAHGGGQRAERERGIFFAKQGFATVDINWGGREMIEGVEPNTAWGKVDPSQGPRFYPGALREHTKLNLLPDQHTIDSVVSPRNGNWYLLAYASRRAITFLENQPEVDREKIGFTGYSMGGNITSMVAIDPRLKAVVPMVGGSGFIMEDFPGLPNTGRGRGFQNIDLYDRTIDAQAYWPHVKCPILFLSASDDFHAVFENLYKSANLIPHDNWRVSQLMHLNHTLGPQQWVLLNRWFDLYLKGEGFDLPKTATPTFELNEGKARFCVRPDRENDVIDLDIYFSHDPNARTRFWESADVKKNGHTWLANLPVRKNLPLYAFANITYSLAEPSPSFGGETDSFSITSNLVAHIPEVVHAENLRAEAQHLPVFEDFTKNKFRDWGFHPRGGISTFKMQDPKRATPPADDSLRIDVNAPRDRLSYRFRILKNRFLAGVDEPQENFSASRNFTTTGKQQIVLGPGDFISREGKAMTDWSNIVTLTIDIYDGNAKSSLHFTDPANGGLISSMQWTSEDH